MGAVFLNIYKCNLYLCVCVWFFYPSAPFLSITFFVVMVARPSFLLRLYRRVVYIYIYMFSVLRKCVCERVSSSTSHVRHPQPK